MPDLNSTPDLIPDDLGNSIATPPADIMAAVEASIIEPLPDAPPADTPPADAPPADQPPVDAPPADQPPADAPPADKPADAPSDDAKPSDEFGELPQDVKAETRERFNGLKTKYDEVVQRATVAEETAAKWHETIRSTGASPEQFGMVLQALKDVNSGTPEGLRRYYDALSAELAPVAKLLGIEAPGVDPLADHADLLERVENRALEREDALELARARAHGRLQETSQATTRQQEQAQQAHDQGMAAVTALGQQLRAADPAGFAAKLPFVTPLIDQVVANLPPSQWVSAITQAYATMPAPAPAPAPPAPAGPVVPNGIRPGPGGSAGNLDKKPGSALEAMDFALGHRA